MQRLARMRPIVFLIAESWASAANPAFRELGRAAADACYRVKFFRADALVGELYRGLADNTVSNVVDGLLHADRVIIR